MSLETVLAAIRYWDDDNPWGLTGSNTIGEFTQEQKTSFEEMITQLYSAPSLQSRLDAYVNSGGLLRVGLGSADFAAPNTDGVYGGYVGLTFAEYVTWDSLGTLHDVPDIEVLAHELGHLTDGNITDPSTTFPTEAQLNSANFDYRGSSVNFENTVMRELGLPYDARSSYFSFYQKTDPEYQEVKDRVRYAPFEDNVAFVRVGTDHADNMDVSARNTTDSIVLIGLAGDDRLVGSNGDDYLYGGDGNDTLDGGLGANFLDGGDGNDLIRSGTGSYSNIFAGQGDDRILAQSQDLDTVYGGDGDDIIGVAGGYSTNIYAGPGADTIFIKPNSHATVEFWDPDGDDQIIWNGYKLGDAKAYISDQETYVDDEGALTTETWFGWADEQGVDYSRTTSTFPDDITNEMITTEGLFIRLPDGGQLFLPVWQNGDAGIRLVGDDPYDVSRRDPGPDSSFGGTPKFSVVQNGVFEGFDGPRLSQEAQHATLFAGPIAVPSFMA